MKKLTFQFSLITPSDVWVPIKGFFTRQKKAVSKYFRDINTSRQQRKAVRCITRALDIYNHFPESRKIMEDWAFTKVQLMSGSPEMGKQIEEWCLEVVFEFFKDNPKERESIAALFNTYFGLDRSTSPTARIVAENILAQELEKRSWGRSMYIKKGGKAYMLVFITTPKGEFRFNLGRYPEDTIPDIGKEALLIEREAVV